MSTPNTHTHTKKTQATPVEESLHHPVRQYARILPDRGGYHDSGSRLRMRGYEEEPLGQRWFEGLPPWPPERVR